MDVCRGRVPRKILGHDELQSSIGLVFTCQIQLPLLALTEWTSTSVSMLDQATKLTARTFFSQAPRVRSAHLGVSVYLMSDGLHFLDIGGEIGARLESTVKTADFRPSPTKERAG